jgi:para-aminobenzoate synthetase component 1
LEAIKTTLSFSALKHIGFSSFDDFFQKAATYASCFQNVFVSPGTRNILPYGGFRRIIAWGSNHVINSLQALEQRKTANWYFGFFSYTLKEKLHQIHAKHADLLKFPDLLFFEAECIIEFLPDSIIIHGKSQKVETLFHAIQSCNPCPTLLKHGGIRTTIDQSAYLQKVEEIKELIRAGEVYELNFCIAHELDKLSGNGVQCFLKLISSYDFPFSAYFKSLCFEIISVSPERFCKKEHTTLICQPIKGTAPRAIDATKDNFHKSTLLQSEKDRAENMMIVDLVRNDLARVCSTGTVKVKELFGIYSYPTIHQMISTVVGQITPNQSISEVIEALFPMGSMTGAPKVNVMHWIDQLENFNRGGYSGSLGYFTPDGDFDLNVIIRSLLINRDLGIGIYGVGSAITIDSDPDAEWLECMLKTKMLFNFFE